MEIVIQSIFIYILALIFALHEIEIEGGNGWAKSLPTWRISSVTSFNLFQTRALTGYHLTLASAVLIIFHIPFIYGLEFNIGNYALLLSKMLVFGIVWDFYWFCFNPKYGLENFNRENIGWYNEKWIFDLFPITYLYAMIGCSILMLISYFSGYTETVISFSVFTALMIIATTLSIPLGRIYRDKRTKINH